MHKITKKEFTVIIVFEKGLENCYPLGSID